MNNIDQNERSITKEELVQLRNKITSNNISNDDYMKIFELFPDTKKEENNQNNSRSNEQVTQLTKTSKVHPSLIDKNGFSNLIYLATMSLVFEIMFIGISFLIFK